eukprot:jgi/Botrbrau1/5795/Bobra.0155s0018.1
MSSQAAVGTISDEMTEEESGIQGEAAGSFQEQLCLIRSARIALESSRASLEQRRNIRSSNCLGRGQGIADLKKLDTSVKRNTALVKKLRQIGEDGLDSLLKDVKATNQSKVGTLHKKLIGT